MKIAVVLAAAVALFASPVLAGCPTFSKPKAQAGGGPLGATYFGGRRQVPPPTRHAPVPDGPLASVRITLQRTGCFGSCPAYAVEIGGDGVVKYHGGAYVLVAGDHSGTIASEDVRCLVDAFRAADFWSLSPEYRAPITDNPTFSLTLSIGGESKTVVDYVGEAVGMPQAVTGLEDAVDQSSGDERWIVGDAQTMPALEAEHFDFRSRAGADLLARAMIVAVESEKSPEAGVRDRIVTGLIDRGAPLDGRADYLQEDLSTAEIAALGGRLDLLRALIRAGLFERGDPALASAILRASVGSQRVDVVAEALRHRPDVNGQDGHGDTALHLISQGGHPHENDSAAPHEDVAIIRLLLKAGADPNIPNHDGKTVLHDVMDPDQARALIAGGARLEVRDADGETPLLAIFMEDVAVVLIEAGADPVVKDRDGQTFFAKARSQNWRRAVAAAQARRMTGGRWPGPLLDAVGQASQEEAIWAVRAGAAIILVGLIGALVAFPWRNAHARRRAAWALALALPPLAAFLWGQAFGVPAGAPPGRTAWISLSLAVPLLAALALPALLAARTKGVRLFVAVVGAACFAATLALAFISTLQAAGAWL
jgi:hypothetical protein